MRDPYEVLEVGQNASMDEIKASYKRLIKKYHPDQYQNNPMADLAQEKLKEVNEAYEQICQMRGEGSGNSGYSYSGSSSSSSSSGSTDYNAVRSYIDMGNLDAAATILNNAQNRNAEWYFLSGMVAYRRGWYDEARNMVQQASNMEPYNLEYRRNLQAMSGSGFRQANPYYQQRNSYEDAFCRACQAYLCLDCLCDCF
ncbi:MAG: DnaJ domain-containing protein [Firmicutes bacterium]|nr:DnaJ domain-containing protein [Bacillota bacterium]